MVVEDLGGGAVDRVADVSPVRVGETRVGQAGLAPIGVAAPVAFFPFSGWKDSFLGDLHAHGTDGVEFFTRKKTVTSRYFSSGQGCSFDAT